ncbi:Ribosomal RNA small subunit methyltransferase B [Acaryochloris thomasi RCC1774]|uniref:16S rRNA (cytosine(967)-C(5))-methyltransferase n=1 Tax=Acaryochloris thomasi RCC1774 TaxID=1764569 RepID=A0A2W1JMH3_9CYAN|nr:Ribosomal RNA small subunit methyltransferase B [Acaryochloris thomasi RCC1774]
MKAVHEGTYADVALNRVLQHPTSDVERRLATELLYGCTRRQRTLDALIDQFAKKPAHQQPPDLRTLLHLGLYQLRYLEQIPVSAAVNTTVELAKQNRLSGLSGFVNGLLRRYARQTDDPLTLPTDPVQHLGVQHSYPDWIIEVWLSQLGAAETELLCIYLNQPPALDIRVNTLKTTRAAVQEQLEAVGIEVEQIAHLPQALRIQDNAGPIPQIPGFKEGWWTVQDASAQLVSHVLDPQPNSVVVDICAAPGGKTTHMAELMQGQGDIWACDRTSSRLRKLQQNLTRLDIHNVQQWTGDSRSLPEQIPPADSLLIDAPCSGLGTLHRHADARWQQTPQTVKQLNQLQSELLAASAQQVKPGGTIVYATCTLHPDENECVIEAFLNNHPGWSIEPPDIAAAHTTWQESSGWMKIWPHQRAMDGFFIAKVKQNIA